MYSPSGYHAQNANLFCGLALRLKEIRSGTANLLLSVVAQITGEDLVYSEAWGTQSACSGCSYVKGHVIEKPKEEVGHH